MKIIVKFIFTIDKLIKVMEIEHRITNRKKFYYYHCFSSWEPNQDFDEL